MQVKRVDLLEALLRVKPGISTRERVEQSASVVFSDGKIAAYNEQIMVLLPFEFDFKGAVRAEELLGILNKLSGEFIDISSDNGQVILKSGRSRSGIRFEESIRLPISDVVSSYEKASMIPLPDGLLPALKKAQFCASQNLNNPNLTGIHVKDGKITATDNYRIIQITVDDKKLKKMPEFVLPAHCVDYLEQYKFDKVGVSESWAFFASEDGLLFCARLIQTGDTYPDVTQILDVTGKELILPTGLLAAIDKSTVFIKNVAHESEKFISVTMKPGHVVIRGEGAFGWYEESVAAKEYTGDALKFHANPQFLCDIIPQIQNAVLGDTSVKFDGSDFTYVFALFHMDEEE